jgi:putative CocE/NonD family hydrolase
MNRIRLLWILPALLTAGSWWQHAPERASADGVYDIYIMGVHVAELTVDESTASPRYSIRKKDVRSNVWRPVKSVAQDGLAADTAFRLWGSLRDFPARIPQFGVVDWSSLQAVGWPDTSTLYVRHAQRAAVIGGDRETGHHWTVKDGSHPVDLIIGSANELIAAFDPTADVVLVRRGYESFTIVGQWLDPVVSQARYGFRALGKSMVPMSDGTQLATLVFLPQGATDAQLPAILIRTPYGISNLIDQYWPYAARGFALVFQATRGTAYWDPQYRSEGTFEPMVHEPDDGRDALDWITHQPWSNGRICMQGGSYVGYTQWSATMAGNPALRCIVPESSMGTAFSDQPYMGGGFVEGLAYYLFWMLDIPVLPDRGWTDILHYRPLIDLDLFATGRDIPQWNAFLEHWRNDEYWKRQNWYRSETRQNFGSFQISGWFDDDLPGTESNWALMQRLGSTAQRLLIGPWKHGYNADRALNGFSFGPDALREDVWLLKQKWYDRHLKDVRNGMDSTVVEYFVLGANDWRTADRWPPANAQPQKWYFHSDGQAHRFTTNGILSQTSPPVVEPPDKYIYDPRHPVPNWMSFEQMQRWEDVQTFPYDFKDIEARSDVVVYTTPPLEENVTIAGDVLAVLYASTNVLDTDWWVHVSDVYPDGQSVRLTTGMLRARFRQLEDTRHHAFGSNFETERLLSGDPQEIVRYEISLRSIANTFRRGHRIRVAIMNALDNYSFPNSNTGGDEARVTETVVGTMVIHKGPDHASHIVLPVIR